jgi:hypothetical protein
MNEKDHRSIYGSDMEEIWRRYGGDKEELPAFSTFFILIIGVVQQPSQ